jgi:hypothetical protein
MEQALLMSRMKMANLSDSATESLGRLSETVSTKAQQTKEDIMEEYEKRRVSTLPDRSNGIHF